MASFASPIAGTSLWQAAWQNGIVYGTSLATWQIEDEYILVVGTRDAAIADVYALFTKTVLAEPAVRTLITFGLSDRYTWLQEDYPREDGEPRRPLPFDENMHPKPPYDALHAGLAGATKREPLWTPPKAE